MRGALAGAGVRWALAAGGVLIVLLAASELLLPGLAERRLRDRLGRYGEVARVEVDAFPALEILASTADRVIVRVDRYGPSPGRLADLLASTEATDELDARASELRSGPLTLRDASLRKEGDRLLGAAVLTETDIRAALPAAIDVRPVASGGGELVLEGTAVVAGRRVSLRARLLARDGRLIVEPEGVPFADLLSRTVFEDERLAVEGVGARRRADGFVLSAQGYLR